MHLLVDISSHGFGHLAMTAPVLNALARRSTALRLTVRSALPPALLRERIDVDFRHVATASDFGYVMLDATRVDLAASARRYREVHADWPGAVDAEARELAALAPDFVLSCVSYRPLAAAARLGLPAAALCSLNWADLFAHYYSAAPWAAPIHAEMLAAYRSAPFLRPAPAMPMPALSDLVDLPPIAATGRGRPLFDEAQRPVLVALGGIAHRLPLENWPRLPGIRWLVSARWACRHPDAVAFESLGLSFTDLLCSVAAVVTKPGYGMFTEAACNGVPVLYQRREDWPEQDCLIDWLHQHGRAAEIDAATLATGALAEPLAALLARPARPCPRPDGADAAADWLLGRLSGRSGASEAVADPLQ